MPFTITGPTKWLDEIGKDNALQQAQSQIDEVEAVRQNVIQTAQTPAAGPVDGQPSFGASVQLGAATNWLSPQPQQQAPPVPSVAPQVETDWFSGQQRPKWDTPENVPLKGFADALGPQSSWVTPSRNEAPVAAPGISRTGQSTGVSSPLSVRSIASAGTRASRFAAEIAQVAAEEGVPADVLAALLDTEDSGEESVSVDGARGLMQVVPGQGFDLPGEDARDPLTSIRQGARAAKEKYRMVGDWDEVGAAYFGYGTDSLGNTTSAYRDKYLANRARYQQQPDTESALPLNGIATGANWRETWGDNLTPDQIKETLALGMDMDAAVATCGPAGALALLRATGGNMTFGQVMDLARKMDEWDAGVGMKNGYVGQIRLLKALGVDAVAKGIDEGEIARTVQSGRPVQINATGSGGHYYTAQDYDPQSRKFNFGNSAGILKASNGQTWFRIDELPALGVGTPSNALYLQGGR